MKKVDYKKELKEFYSGKVGDFKLVRVPKFNFLMIDGQGSPGEEEYTTAVQALYPIAYNLKFMSKLENGNDFTVMPLQGLWWADDMSAFTDRRRDEWRWTMMIMQPAVIEKAMFDAAVIAVKEKKESTET